MSTSVDTRPPTPIEPTTRRPPPWLLVVGAVLLLVIGLLVGRWLTATPATEDASVPDTPVAPTDDEPVDAAPTPPVDAPDPDATDPDDTPAQDEPAPEPVFGEEARANWDVVGVSTGDVLNVREGPGTGFAIIAELPANAVELESTGRVATVGSQTWRELVVPGDGVGWVNAAFLREHRPDPQRGDIGVGLPMDARLTAQELFTFADRGDLDSLARLALDRDEPFTASFGEGFTTPEQLVAYWEGIGTDEVTGAMVALVRLPDWYVTTGSDASGAELDIHVTPRFMHEPTAANRAALEAAIGPAAVEAGLADGQWLGWRLGITADGDWRFFVRGD